MYQFRTVFNAKTSKWNIQFLQEATFLGAPLWHKWVTATKAGESSRLEVVEFDTFDQLHEYIAQRGLARVYAHHSSDAGHSQVDFTRLPSAQAEVDSHADLLHKAIDALAANRPAQQAKIAQPAAVRRPREMLNPAMA